MMGCKQRREGKLFYSLFSLDQRIRPDNPLRRIRQLIDFSFARRATDDFFGYFIKAVGGNDGYGGMEFR